MVLSHYFDSAKFTSFTRRLKRWNFKRVPRGPELGAYYNKNFIRDQPELVQQMRYRMDGKFDEGKKSGEEKNEEKDNLEDQKKNEENDESEDQTEKEGEAQQSPLTKELVQEQKLKEQKLQDQKLQEQKLQEQMPAKIPSPNSQEVQANESLRHISQGPTLNQHMHVPFPRINTNFAYIQDRPLPLPKRPKVPKMNVPPTIHKSNSAAPNEINRNHPALLSKGYEIQRELLMNRSMLSHEVATGRPASGLGPTSSSTMSNHMHSNNHNNHMLLEVERAGRIERIIEAERILGLARLNPDHHGRNAAFPN